MKKLIITLVLAVVFIFQACAAGEPAKDGDYVTLFISPAVQIDEGETLFEYMRSIKGSKTLLSYTFSDGMLTEINSKRASGNTYWMLYTSDEELSSSEWGSVEIDGVTYYSATLGAEQLPIKSGHYYIWYAQTF